MKNQQDSLLRKISYMAIFYFLGLSVVFAQNKVIKGTVSDDSGEALPGVTVVIKGSLGGVITDVDGKFALEVPSSGILEAPSSGILVFSFIGMQTQEVAIDGRNTYRIQMVSLANELDDVTVVAFAKQKKESVISAITTVSPKELKIPVSNLTNALAGRMSGIISYQQSGEPGRDNAQFFIRGVTTFGYRKDPLILIDNIELSADDLARMNVDDIAQFSIMKDATATALYGARGANGVILVTTKEGSTGKTKVSVRMEHSISEPTKMVDLADPITYMNLNNEAVVARNPALGNYYKYSQEKIERTKANVNPYAYPSLNWYDELFKKSTTTERVNANINGGGDIARYFIAMSYAKDNGVLKNDKLNNFNSNIDLNKYTVRSNVNLNLTKSTEIIVRVSGSFDDYSGPIDGGNETFEKVMRTNPVMFPKSFPAVGDYEGATHVLFGNAVSSGGSEGPAYMNPYADMVRGYKEYNRTNISAQLEAKQDLSALIEGLRARVLLNTVRYSYSDVSRKYNPFYYASGGYDPKTNTYQLQELNPTQGTEYLDYNEGTKDVTTTNYVEMSFDYNRAFGDHNVSGMLVLTMQDRKISNSGNIQRSLPFRNQGLAGRFTYAYQSKYFTEFNFGYNGSERFSAKERFGFFPSIGAGYIISNESFWEPLQKTVNKLKFKFTYGLVGNDAIGSEDDRFFYLSNLNMGDGGKTVDFGKEYANPKGKPGISVIRYANDLITWERSKKMNVGFELGLFNNIEIQADFFNEYRDHILQTRSYITSTMGLLSSANPKANVGEASSRGIDFSVDYKSFIGKDFWASARANFTYATSRYEVLEEANYASIGRPWSSAIGRNLSQWSGYIAERLFIDENDIANSPLQTFGEYMAGDIKYKDINNDGQITDADRVYFGYPTTPEITYGFGFSTGYKNFDLSMFFQGNARVSFYLDPGRIAPFVSETALLDKIATDHWSEDNKNLYAFWPRLAGGHIGNNLQTSTWWMQDGTFIRMKTMELGYSLPKKIIKSIGMESCRIYLSGNNLFTMSKFKLWDTEMGGNGLGYPIQRVYNIGLNINF
ncbi:SusC/RagA family TonB-linked outer membrane protein [Dysgonomonas reticulitermitis]